MQDKEKAGERPVQHVSDDPRWIKAPFSSTCTGCGSQIVLGDCIHYWPNKGLAYCKDCYSGPTYGEILRALTGEVTMKQSTKFEMPREASIHLRMAKSTAVRLARSTMTVLMINDEIAQEDRDLLADTIDHDGDLYVDRRIEQVMVEHGVTVEAVLIALREAKAEKDAKEAAWKVKEQEALDAWVAKLRRRETTTRTLDSRHGGDRTWTIIEPDTRQPYLHGIAIEWSDLPEDLRAEVDAWVAELRANAEAVENDLDEHDRLIDEQRTAERRTFREAEKEERRQWIEEHGSERLKRCVAENMEHDAIYRDERLAVDRPGWRWVEDGQGDEWSICNPTVEVLELLDRGREMVPETELVWVKWEEDGVQKADARVRTDFLGRRIEFWPPDTERVGKDEWSGDYPALGCVRLEALEGDVGAIEVLSKLAWYAVAIANGSTAWRPALMDFVNRNELLG